MKRITFTTLTGLLAMVAPMFAQTSTTGFAPANFGNFIVTSTPSNATGNSGVSTVFTSSGSRFNFGTGGALVNPMQFNYTVTGPNTATITSKTSASQPATVTNLVFTGRNSGTYTTVAGTDTTTGRFNLAEIPGAAPLSNVSARATVGNGKTAIVGFVIAGTMPRRVLIRADGPVLKAFGVTNALQHPMLTLYSGQAVVARNSAWGTMQGITTGTASGGTTSGGMTTVTGTMANGMFTGTLPDGSSFSTQLATANDFTQVGAFALPQGSNDNAIVAELPPGAYTVVVGPASATTGTSTGTSSSGAITGTSSGSTSSGSTTGTSSTSTSSTGGTTSGGTSSGTSSSTTSSSSTSSGGTTSGGTSSGGASSGTTSTTAGSTASTGTTAASASGDVLVEVYFLQ